MASSSSRKHKMSGDWSNMEDGNTNDVKMTSAVVLTSIVAASSGMLFGYDIGVSGGITTMVPFLKTFFPQVLEKMAQAKHDYYCVYDSHVVTAFTSSLYIAALTSSLVAGRLTASLGRKAALLIGGCFYLVGTAVNAGAINVAMLLLGRVLLGFGVGFTNQSAPVYLNEMAPPKWRGAFSTGFQLFIQIGIVTATLVNFAASHYGDSGWRIATATSGVPSLLMIIGVLFIPDTPRSLLSRGLVQKAREALTQARGINSNIEPEFIEIIASNEASKTVKQDPYKTIIQRQYRPHLVIAIAIPSFQQLTGINVTAFYAPVLFQSIGMGSNSALLAAVILAVVSLIAIVLSGFVVDRCGRKFLFLEAGIQMIICQVIIACVLALKVGASGTDPISKGTAEIVLVLMCLYAAAWAWSWGPLTWLIPSEVLPMEVRPAGQSIGNAINFGLTFILAQTFLSMLCHFKYASFLFYAAWILFMTVFVGLFLPETKGVPLENMHTLWKEHWYWRRFVYERTTEASGR